MARQQAKRHAPRASARVPAAGPGPASETDVVRRRSRGARAFARKYLRDRAAAGGMLLVMVFVAAALLAPVLAPYDPIKIDLAHTLERPSRVHYFGTDNLGRDVYSRILYGSRLSLGTACVAAAVVMTLGVAIGLFSGLRGGWADGLIMRVVDGLLAFPNLILALAIAGSLGGGLYSVIIGLTAVWWASYARLVRGLVLQIRERPFVEAARATGTSSFGTAYRHVLPNIIPHVIVLLTINLGALILAVSALSFLGIGAQPPAPEWGAMLNDGRRFLFTDPLLMVFPGAAIFCVVLGFNLMGDGLRDVLDPKGVTGRA